MDSKAVPPGYDNDVAWSKSGGFEHGKGQRCAGVGNDLSRLRTHGYLAKYAVGWWWHAVEVTPPDQRDPGNLPVLVLGGPSSDEYVGYNFPSCGVQVEQGSKGLVQCDPNRPEQRGMASEN